MQFGQNLRALRMRRGWTQQQLADYLGKTKNNISQYELGKREPNIQQLTQFARLLGATVDHLLSFEENGVPSLYEPESFNYSAAQRIAPVFTEAPLTTPVDYQPIPSDLSDPTRLFFFVAKGDDMRDFRIESGDLLLLTRVSEVTEAGLYLTSRSSQATVRMLRPAQDGRCLMLASARVPPEWVSLASLTVLGRVLRVEFSVD